MTQNSMPTMDLPAVHPFYPDAGRPTWEVALGFPPQGRWTPEEYFALEDHIGGAFRAELVAGFLEVLPMPKKIHQLIAGFLYRALWAWVESRSLGLVMFSGLRVRVANGQNPKFREPDIVFLSTENQGRAGEEFSDGADLVMEVVSEDPKDHKRDYETKVDEYAAAGIGEYWIVDPQARLVRVLTLEEGAYRIHGDFKPGQQADSVLLPGFVLNVEAILKGGER